MVGLAFLLAVTFTSLWFSLLVSCRAWSLSLFLFLFLSLLVSVSLSFLSLSPFFSAQAILAQG